MKIKYKKFFKGKLKVTVLEKILFNKPEIEKIVFNEPILYKGITFKDK